MSFSLLREFMPALIERGLQFDLTGTQIVHTHNKIDASQLRPPFKFHLCTREMRPEGRMTDDDINTIGYLMWQAAKSAKLDIEALASVPRVGDAIADAFLRAAKADGFSCPVLRFSKFDHKGVSLIGPVADDAGYPQGRRVWIIDDVVHRWTSKKRLMTQVINGGWRVAGILVFLDYDKGAFEFFRTLGIELHSLTTVSFVLSCGHGDGTLTTEQFTAAMEYLQNS